MDESIQVAIEQQITELGLEQYFDIQAEEINCKVTGAHFFYRGFTRNIGSLRSLESVDILWIEEAQYLTGDSWEAIEPTIRKQGSEIWITFNPWHSTDAVWQHFCANPPPPRTFLHKVNYLENKFRGAEVDESAEFWRKTRPHRYPHMWLGELDDASDDLRRVLPFHFLDASVRQPDYDWAKEPVRAGFDVADEGDDDSSMVIRQGPVVVHMSTFGRDIQSSCERVYELCKEYEVRDLWFDSTGLGLGVRDRFRDKMPCKNVVGVNFSSKVKGKKVMFELQQKNEDAFALHIGQLGWNMHMRAEHSRRSLVEPEMKIDDRRCLYILPDAIDPNIRAHLAQPTWSLNQKGQIRIEKKPKGVSKSPDGYDALILSYAHDARNGIKSGGRHLIVDGSERELVKVR